MSARRYREFVGKLVWLPFGLIICAIVLPLFGLIGLWAVAINYLSECYFYLKMRQRGRFLRWQRACKRIGAEGGTLIIESPSGGWNFTHAWWTPDDMLAISPYPVPTNDEYIEAGMRCLSWDKWCWDHYTSPNGGRAFLIRVWSGAAVEKKLTKSCPKLNVAHTWTALVHIPPSPETPDADLAMDGEPQISRVEMVIFFLGMACTAAALILVLIVKDRELSWPLWITSIGLALTGAVLMLRR